MLKPCPFCGGEAKVERRDVEPQGDPWYGIKLETFVLCTKCGACLFDEFFHEGFINDEKAIEAWNTRPDGVVELIEFTHNLLGEYNALPDEWEHFELIKSIIMENKKALAAVGGEHE